MSKIYSFLLLLKGVLMKVTTTIDEIRKKKTIVTEDKGITTVKEFPLDADIKVEKKDETISSK